MHCKGQRTPGEDAPEVIMVDRGFISRPLFADWKRQGLDMVLPLHRNISLLKDMQGLSRLKDGLEVRLKDSKSKQTVIKSFSDLTSLESHPGKLSGLLVTQYRGLST